MRSQANLGLPASAILFLALLLPSIANSADQTVSRNMIRVKVIGLRNNHGAVLCGLYTSADGSATKAEDTIKVVKAEIEDQAAVCELTGIAPGRYAVWTLHDENSNGKMDTNFIGLPKEGFGNSNDAKGTFGPPKFRDAAFQFTGGTLEIQITMTYLL